MYTHRSKADWNYISVYFMSTRESENSSNFMMTVNTISINHHDCKYMHLRNQVIQKPEFTCTPTASLKRGNDIA